MSKIGKVDLGYVSLVSGMTPSGGDGGVRTIEVQVPVAASAPKVTMSGITSGTYLSSEAPKTYTVSALVTKGVPYALTKIQLYVNGKVVQTKNITDEGKYSFSPISISVTSSVYVRVVDAGEQNGDSSKVSVAFGEYCYEGLWTSKNEFDSLDGNWVVSNWSGSANRSIRSVSKTSAKTYTTGTTNAHVVWVVPSSFTPAAKEPLVVAYIGSSEVTSTSGYYKKTITIDGVSYDVYASKWQTMNCKFRLN